MTRRELIDFIKNEICPQITLQKYGREAFFSFSFKETGILIEKWRRNNSFPQAMKAKVDNGFLFINGKPVGRIAGLPVPIYKEKSYYTPFLSIEAK